MGLLCHLILSSSVAYRFVRRTGASRLGVYDCIIYGHQVVAFEEMYCVARHLFTVAAKDNITF